jgi:signal transduction histidine kinase/DNA-binding response OmpR family regulator/ligand-binding sensor domain-containing protein
MLISINKPNSSRQTLTEVSVGYSDNPNIKYSYGSFAMASWFRIILVFLLLPPLLYSQNNIMKFEHLTTDDGLSGSVIECIIQDSKGFMWFGTRNGLNKYDGYKFTIYRHDANNPYSISNNWIVDIIEDSKGDLWISTRGGGLNKFDRSKEIFFQYRHDDKNPHSICNNFTGRVLKDKSGNLWIGTVSGLSKIIDFENLDSYDDIQFVNYRHDLTDPYSLSDDLVLSIYEDCEGILWIATVRGGINILERDSDRFTNKNNLSVMRFGFIKHPLMNEIYRFLEDSTDMDSVITIVAASGTFKINKKNNQITNFSRDLSKSLNISIEKIGHVIGEDRSGRFWITPARYSGLYVTNTSKDKAFALYPDPQNPFSISNNTVHCWYEDKEGIIWLGTRDGGVNKYIKKRDAFNILSPTINDSACSINSIYEDISENELILWIGTEKHGLLKYNAETRKLEQYKIEYPVRSVFQTRHDPDHIWIGALWGGLVEFNKKSKTFSGEYFYESKEHSMKLGLTEIVLSITSDEEGILWIGTAGGLIKFDPVSKKFKHYYTDLSKNSGPSDNQINSLYFSHYKNKPALWVGTRFGGLNRFDLKTETFYHFKNDLDDSLSIASDYVSSIYEDESGNLWIGTTGGLQKFDREKNKFMRYTDKEGLLNIDIMGILGDTGGKLWLHTKSGICRYNPKNGDLRFFDKNDGLPGKDFFRYAYHIGKSGNLYFGGNNKILTFDPADIQKNTKIPPIVITDFQIFNKSIKPGKNSPLSKSISNADEIILAYDQSVFSFEFAALDYHDPSKHKYAYKMEGVDPEWVYTNSSRRFATYTNLDPGDYIFKVKGSNNDNVWNEEGISIKIIITPPWWRTDLAYLLYVILVISAVLGIWRLQTNRLKIKQKMEMEHFEAEKLREIDHMKSRFFANISHEFRTPLTLIEGPVKQMLSGELKGNLQEQYKMILRYSNRLLKLITQILDLSKLEAGHMSLKVSCTDIFQFLKGITQSFASLAEGKKITLKFLADKEPIIGYIDKDKLEKIATNLLSNAFKFTPDGGTVKVDLSLRGDMAQTRSTKQSPFSDMDEIATSRQVGRRLDSSRTRNDTGTGRLQIKIFNSGAGIPSNQMDKIFDRFYQAGNSKSKDSESTGIGLALTKELVESHHGEIRTESELNKGTIFIVWLPIEKEHYKPEEIEDIPLSPLDEVLDPSKGELKGDVLVDISTEKTVTKHQAPKSAPLLLIVEDNPDVTAYISSFLKEDHWIITAENGEAGFKKALEKFPDLIISDVMMPVMDGFQLCRKLKSDQRTSHIPLILLTARADIDSKLEGLEFGADDYLTKPFDSKELSMRTKNLLEQRHRLRNHFQREVDFHPADITVNSMDEQFMEKAVELIERHIDENDFSVERFSREVGMSRQHLNRKLHALTNHSARDFIRTIRLKRAAKLLQKKSDLVTQIAYQVGFDNPSYFAQCFRKQFGVSPSKYTAQHSR